MHHDHAEAAEQSADQQPSLVPDDTPPAANDAPPLGRVIAVGGAQVTVAFSTAALLARDDGTDVTVGTFLGISSGNSFVVGALCDVTLENTADGGARAVGRMDLLGEIVGDASGVARFHRGVMVYPRIGSAILPIGNDELAIIFDVKGAHTIDVGKLQQNSAIGAYIDVDSMVRKHFAIFGSTGAGKSSAVALILREVMEARPDLRILLIDPHNEYGQCFDDRAHVVRPGNLHVPYWLFSFDEIVEIIFGARTDVEQEVNLFAELIPLAKNEYARRRAAADRGRYRQFEAEGGRYTVDTPVPYRMEDLVALAESRMGKLENNALAGHYQRLLLRINAARKNPRYSFIFDAPGDGGDTMVDILCELLRLQHDGQPITVMQLAGFPAEALEVIVSVLFRLAFEFGLWSDGSLPLLIVCEEAHNYANADRTVGFRPAREALARIAKEGRKYGVFLGLVSQRPSQLEATLISQCSTVFAMRMGHEDDQNIVRAAISDPGNRVLGFLPSLGTRETLAIGAGVPVVARLRFHQLPERLVPRSQAVWGGAMDAGTKLAQRTVANVVARWRGVAMSNRPVEPVQSDGFFPAEAAANWSVAGYRR
jgi:DNA helicase HerA-like ATPase